MCDPISKIPGPEVIPISFGFVKSFIVRGTDGLVLVDTGTKGSEQKILHRVAVMGFRPDQIGLILLTHAHADHTGGAHALRLTTGAKVAIHTRDAEYLIAGKSADVVPASFMGRIMGGITRLGPQMTAGVTPDIVFEDEFDLTPFGVDGRVISTPGHTAGSASVVLDSGACLVGDLVSAWRKPGYPPFAQDLDMLRQSILKVLRAGARQVYPFTEGLVPAKRFPES